MKYTAVPEIQSLLTAVEIKYGKPILSTNDFNTLSAIIRFEGHENLSPSTLKRLWGYVSQETTPRRATLDILSRFVGKSNFSDFCISLLGSYSDSSCYTETRYLSADEVAEGGIIAIGWEPNRLVKLRKLKDNTFEVVESHNSKLELGDKMMCSCFFKGLPLVVPGIIRDGKQLPSYIAGKANGLNVLSVES